MLFHTIPNLYFISFLAVFISSLAWGPLVANNAGKKVKICVYIFCLIGLGLILSILILKQDVRKIKISEHPAFVTFYSDSVLVVDSITNEKTFYKTLKESNFLKKPVKISEYKIENHTYGVTIPGGYEFYVEKK